jgi:uncharacterized membrane protein
MTLPVLAQALGALAVLVGIALVLPPGPALVVGGLTLLVLATLAEMVAMGRRRAPQDRRSGPSSAGVV